MYFGSKHVPCMPMHVWCRLARVVLQRLACRCVRFLYVRYCIQLFIILEF